MRTLYRQVVTCLLFVLLCEGLTQPTYAYSLLTHALLVDILWQGQIVPVLTKFYGPLTRSQLAEARSYAIGGALIQDAGYYSDVPSEKLFADYTHYIRTGDFVVNLLRNARNPDELAFAIGALTHYVGDSTGHPEATNMAVGSSLEIKALCRIDGKAYSDIKPDALGRVTYAQCPQRHYTVETGFDINGVLANRFPPRKLIRIHYMNVELQQLTYAYFQTYGTLQDMTYTGSALDLSTYMGSGGSKLPLAVTLLADIQKDKKPVAEKETPELKRYRDLIAQVAAQDDWKSYRGKIDWKEKAAQAGYQFVKSRPKFQDLTDIERPTIDTQQMYVKSVVDSVDVLTSLLAQMRTGASIVPVMAPQRLDAALHPLPNVNLDTGDLTATSEYSLTDKAYGDLLGDLFNDSRNVDFSPREMKCSPWPITSQSKADLGDFFARPGKLAEVDQIKLTAVQGMPTTSPMSATTESCPCKELGNGKTAVDCSVLPKQP